MSKTLHVLEEKEVRQLIAELRGERITVDNLQTDEIVLLQRRVDALEGEAEKKTEDELKPCPFCPGDTNLGIHQPPGRVYFSVHCYLCGCHGPLCKTEEKARTMWNEWRQDLKQECETYWPSGSNVDGTKT